MNTGFARRHTREPQAGDAPKAPGGAIRAQASGRVKIGFVGLSAGAGATTLAFAAAEYLAALPEKPRAGSAGALAPGGFIPPDGHFPPGMGFPPPLSQAKRAVSMLELDTRPDAPAGRPYDKIGIDRRFAGRDYIPFYRLAAEGKPLQDARNIDGGVNWALRIPGEPGPAPSPVTLHRLLNNIAGDIVICDISAHGILASAGAPAPGYYPASGASAPGGNFPIGSSPTPAGLTADAGARATLLALLADLDHAICVFDPLPSRLLAAVPAAETCRAAAASGVPVTWAFNKLNAGVNLREATRFTGIRDYLPFPAAPAEAVYGAEYACRSLASEPGVKAALATLFG